MEWLDYVIAATYVAAFLKTHKKEYVYCFFAHLFCLLFFWTIGEEFSVKNNGVECLYFAALSSIWLYTISLIKVKTKACFAMLMMSTYELLCSIESFIWQFIMPVTTPVIDYYIYNVVAIHVIILISVYKWGVRVERNDSYNYDNFRAFFSRKNVARNIKVLKR